MAKTMVYVGDDTRLKGRTALVREDPESNSRGALAQFDPIKNAKETHMPGRILELRGMSYDRWCFNWHSFYYHEFEEVNHETKSQ